MTLDLLKRRPVYITILLVVVLAIVWYLAWWSPEGGKLKNVNSDIATKQQTVSQLQVEIAGLRSETANNAADTAYESTFSNALPPGPEFDTLTESLYQLSRRTGTQVTSLTANTMVATTPAPAVPYSEIPISMTVTGPRQGVLDFIAGIYNPQYIPRLMTISTLSLSDSSAVNIVKPSKVEFSASITAQAYTTFLPTSAAG